MMYLPETYKNEMKRILGDEYKEYEASLTQTRCYGLRVNTAKISIQDFEKICPFPIRKIPFVENGYYYNEDVQPAKHPYYFAGLYYLQDPSAMIPASRLPVNEGEAVLDLCAAPGGKTTELGAKLNGTGILVSNDISVKRAKALLKNVQLFGIPNSFVLTEYPHKLAGVFSEFFDKILVDAPCSGEGMFRKDPAMVKAWEENGPEFYAKLQREILEEAVTMLKPGGMLLYSTCTFSPLEDEGTVDFILKNHSELSLAPMEGYEGFVNGRGELIGSKYDMSACIRVFPHKMEGEGHFLALLKKENEGNDSIPIQNSNFGLKGEVRKYFEDFAANFTKSFENSRLDAKNGMIYYMPKKVPSLRGLKYIRGGLFMGECKKNRFEPSQALAVALKKEDYRNTIDFRVEDERVVRYLKGETIILSESEAAHKKGWQLVCVSGYPLGWAKLTGTNLKNKYFSAWRMM